MSNPKHPKILNLIHPCLGVVSSQAFWIFQCRDTKTVLKTIYRWKKKYGKNYLICTQEWLKKERRSC